MYSFHQAVAAPTHKLRHTPDIVLFTPTYDNVRFTTVTQLPSSDHYCDVRNFSATKTINRAELKQSRNLRDINLTIFRADIFQLISHTLCLLKMLNGR